MKARVIATGEIIEVVFNGFYYDSIKDERTFDKPELEIIPKTKDPDYWTRLEHQYAGMAMQGILSNTELTNLSQKVEIISAANVTKVATRFAHALVEMYKEKEEM